MVKMRQKACQHNSYRRRQQAAIGLIRFVDIIQISLWNMRPESGRNDEHQSSSNNQIIALWILCKTMKHTTEQPLQSDKCRSQQPRGEESMMLSKHPLFAIDFNWIPDCHTEYHLRLSRASFCVRYKSTSSSSSSQLANWLNHIKWN